MHKNNLSGQVPESLSKLEGLESLLINNNKLEGNLPKEFDKLQKIKTFHCHNNKLGGDVPAFCGNVERGNDSTEESSGFDLVYGNNQWNDGHTNIELSAPLFEQPIKDDRKAVIKCWNAMGGELKELYHEGGDKDVQKWKGIKVKKNRVTEIDWSGMNMSPSKPKLGDYVIHIEDSNGSYKIKAVNSSGSYEIENKEKEGDVKTVELDMLMNEEKIRYVSRIADEIGDLEKLEKLNLEANGLTGAIPIWIGTCTKLKHLNLQKNKLNGGEFES